MASSGSQWTDVLDDDLTVDHVNQLLLPIHDDLWVAAACTDRLVDDINLQRALLELGIARTEPAVQRATDKLRYLPEDVDDGEENGKSQQTTEAQRIHASLTAHFSAHRTDAQLCAMRAVLLERLDRLNTYVEIRQRMPAAAVDLEVVGDVEEGWEDDPWAETNDGASSQQPPSNTSTVTMDPPLPLSVFLTCGLPLMCSALATQLHFDALLALMERHHPQLFPYRYSILDSIPEYARPSEYRSFLPAVDAVTGMELAFSSKPWRETTDWSESADVKSTLAGEGWPQFDVAEDPEIDWMPQNDLIPASEVQAWYKRRVDFMVSTSGMIDNALGLVQHGASQGVPGLDEVGEELSLISRLVYDAPRPPGQDDGVSITLSEWRSLEPSAAIARYLAYSTPHSVVSDIRKLVLPYLFVLESRHERAGKPDPKLSTRLLYNYILNVPLQMAAPLFEASKPTLITSQRLISDDEDLARLALACLYGSSSLDEWPTMSRIFECLPAWNMETSGQDDEAEADTTVASLGAFLVPTTARPQCTPSELLMFFAPLSTKSLSHTLDILDVHLESGEIMARWKVPAPLRWFLQSANSEAQQRAWATRMARQQGAYIATLQSEDDWLSLLDDMLKLCGTGDAIVKSAFGLLSQEEVTRIFYSGLLNSGNFAIAKSLLNDQDEDRSLSPDVIEELVLARSREFYDNASSGNYKFGDMKLAHDCLSVAPNSSAIQKERDFIEATSRICSFNVTSRPGVPISPIEIRLTKDKLSLVSRVLTSNETAYEHTPLILELTKKLGFSNDKVAEVRTLAMIADTALQAENFDHAFVTCREMLNLVAALRAAALLGADNPQVKEAVNVCWVSCFQLGRQEEFSDKKKRLTLLSHALELCPPENLHDILTIWRRLEEEDIVERRQQLAGRQSHSGPAPKQNGYIGGTASTLAARLHDLHIHSPSMPSAPDAAALASHAFSRVAATFPFSVRGRTSEDTQRGSRDGSQNHEGNRPRSPDVQGHARHALTRGIGWLIGAEEDEL